jgi:hypothetical protein
VALSSNSRIFGAKEVTRPLCKFVHAAYQCSYLGFSRPFSLPKKLLYAEGCPVGIVDIFFLDAYG